MRKLTILLLLASAGLAQQTVAPTAEPVGSTRGKDYEGYNILNSIETGYRFSAIDGNEGKYRSDVNFHNGIRLLGGNFSMHSKNGHGRFFDEIVWSALGLGNDPYESSMLRIQKNKLYRYDMLWRMNEYVNPALTISEGRHLMTTTRQFQDHDLVLLPQSKLQLRLGYTRNAQDGAALSTVQLFDSRGDEFAPFVNVRRLRNEFRLGADAEFAGFKLSFLHGWDNFKEDTPYALGEDLGANPTDRTTLTAFRRAEPIHGNSPYWRGNLRTERKLWAVNGRLTYVGGRRDFVMDEGAVGVSRGSISRQILVTGNARRPVTAGDFLVSFFPTSRLTFTNNTSAHSTRIDGDSVYREVNNFVPSDKLLFFQYLGIRTVTNSTDAVFRASNWLSVTGGYHYSARRIRSKESYDIPPFGGDSVVAEQDNHVHSGAFGVRLKPAKPLTLTLDAEILRADRPFTPISERNFHTIGGRMKYRQKNYRLSAAYRENYNTNSVLLSAHSARARSYTFDASWTPRSWFAVDAGYSKLHLDTVSGIAFFAGGELLGGLRSIYISNVHAGNLGARFAIKKLADVYVGYSITRDLGDGRAAPVPAGADPVTLLLSPVQTFPLNFESPLARLSVRLRNKVRWNFGYQFYHYREDFQLAFRPQNYRAHTGYTSLLWSF